MSSKSSKAKGAAAIVAAASMAFTAVPTTAFADEIEKPTQEIVEPQEEKENIVIIPEANENTSDKEEQEQEEIINDDNPNDEVIDIETPFDDSVEIEEDAEANENAEAYVELNGTRTYYDTLQEAIDASNGSTVILNKDYTTSDTTWIDSPNVTVDLNGHTITGTNTVFSIVEGGNDAVIKNGSLVENGSRVYAISVNSGATSTIENVNISVPNSSLGIAASSGTTTIDGVNITGAGNVALVQVAYDAHLVMKNSHVSGDVAANYAVSLFHSATLDMDENSSVYNSKCVGLMLQSQSAGYTCTANIAGSVKTDSIYAAIQTNGNAKGVENINLLPGADITGTTSMAIYAPAANNNIVIEDGATLTGASGIELRGGSLTMNGGVVKSTASSLLVSSNKNGSTVQQGAGIAAVQHTHEAPLTVTINGGTISGPCAFYESNVQPTSDDGIAKVSLAITGGDFISTTGEDAVVSDDKNGFITGGTFSSEVPEGYISDGLVRVENTDGTYTVEDEAIAANCCYIEVDGVKTYYATLADAIAKVAANQTITLYKDTTESVQLKISEAGVTLDLGGNTVTSAYKSAYPFFNLTQHNITIKNGTIDSSVTKYTAQTTGNDAFENIVIRSSQNGVNVVANKVTFTGCTFDMSSTGKLYAINAGYSTYKGMASVALVNTTIKNNGGAQFAGQGIQLQYGAKLTMDASSTIDMTTGIGIQVRDDSKADIAGSVHSADYFAITSNGSKGENPTINILDGAAATSEGPSAAVYLPAPLGTTTIGTATITGLDGVQVRGGTLTVNGANITSTAQVLTTDDSNTSGSVGVGAAVSCVVHTHNVAPKVTLNSGTFAGPVAFYEADAEGVGSAVTDAQEIDLAGGNYVSTTGLTPVMSGTQSGFITGGNYSSGLVAEYVAPGNIVTKTSGVADAPWTLDEVNDDTYADQNDENAGYIEFADGSRAYYADLNELKQAAEKAGIDYKLCTRTITFVDRNGNVLGTVDVDYGTGVKDSDVPELSDAQKTYKDASGKTY